MGYRVGPYLGLDEIKSQSLIIIFIIISYLFRFICYGFYDLSVRVYLFGFFRIYLLGFLGFIC